MTRPIRAQVWHDLETVEEQPPATPSFDREPWRLLESSSRMRFFDQRGRELNPGQVDPRKRAELLMALETRHMLGSVYATLKARGYSGVSKEQQATLDLLVFGFADVRENKSGDFQLTFRSFRRKARFTVQELYSKTFELRRLVGRPT